ncbi:metal ABC transporter permease [Tengunoibacter tsumagoiensis]|uniref:ABC transporter permease n=1 Tax=Tengunoibacter tsumagoiensis TaxID=2014871 RepID=A0A402AAQ1_9CHLR|nr:metal ABC transporter permease [Tengunoibacter tsumagoiensis]GCE16200.1 ABC transporter permease [Tengunoibacter tsumagoiensis]
MWNLFQQEFVQNAFIGGGIVAVVAGLMGYFVVLRAQSFATEALTDIGFAGATAGALLGLSSLVGMLLLTFLSALGMGALGDRLRGRDVEIGMVLSFALGLGVLFLTLYAQSSASHSSAGMNILFGSILAVTRADLWISLICSCLILLILACLFRPLLFASIDPVVAETRGVPVRLLSIIFLVLLAITTAESVLVIGVLLVFALLVAPAATAIYITHRPRTTLLVSVCLSLFFTWGGLILTFMGTGRQLPAGFYIATLSACSYFVAVVIRRFRAPHRAVASSHCNDCADQNLSKLC